MNLASSWYGTGNGIWLGIGHGTSTALGTVMTIRPAWLRMSWARRAQEPGVCSQASCGPP
jgi:hypothetical protein